MTAASSSLPQPRAQTRRDPLALYEPQRISVHSRWRFIRSRRLHYLSSLGDRAPTPIEADIIDQLCRISWDERVIRGEAEGEADPRARMDLRRQAAELGRQLILLRRDLDRAAPPPTAAPRPDPFDALRELMAPRHRGDAA